jgi:hypothetical protein
VASQLRALLHGRNFAERDAAISHANHAVKAALYRAGCLEVANLGAPVRPVEGFLMGLKFSLNVVHGLRRLSIWIDPVRAQSRPPVPLRS